MKNARVVEPRAGGSLSQPAWDFAALLDAAPIAVFVLALDGTIQFVNRELSRLTGWHRTGIVGRSVDVLVAAPSRCRRADGTWFDAEVVSSPALLEAGGLVVSAVLDNSDRVRTEAELFYRATHDGLTGLANRWLFSDRLAHALERLARRGGALAVLFLDLDRFKKVNDARGHAAGDAILRTVARAVEDAVRPTDTVARVGGDEFVVLCESVDENAAREVAERVRVAVAAATDHELCTDAFTVRASVGIVLAMGATDPDGLIDAADQAMYEAKRAGGDRIAFATPG